MSEVGKIGTNKKTILSSDLLAGMVLAEDILDNQGKPLVTVNTLITSEIIQKIKKCKVEKTAIWETESLLKNIFSSTGSYSANGAVKTSDSFVEKKQFLLTTGDVTEEEVRFILSGAGRTNPGKVTVEHYSILDIGSPSCLIGKSELSSLQYKYNLCETMFINVRKKEYLVFDEMWIIVNSVYEFIMDTVGVVNYVLRNPSLDKDYGHHSVNVAILAGKLALLAGFGSKQVMDIIMTAILHDIGKYNWFGKGVIDNDLYKNHPKEAYMLLKDRKFMSKDVLLGITQHHEKNDGTGFPMKVKDSQIHPYAKIVKIADYVDGLARKNNNVLEIVKFLNSDSYGNLDPYYAGFLINYFEDLFRSNYVNLNDGRMGEVVYFHCSMLSPVVRTEDGDIIEINGSSAFKIVGLAT